MSKKIKVAFDLDGVIVDKPPIIPKTLLEYFFRGSKKQLDYHFPRRKIDQYLRKFSHFYLFRPPISINISLIKKLFQQQNLELLIISSRYSFLNRETENWLNKREVKKYFKEIFTNTSDEKPHLCKEKIIKKVKPDIFIDDDADVVNYLKTKFPGIKFFVFSKDDPLDLNKLLK